MHDTFNQREGVQGVYNEVPEIPPEPEVRRRAVGPPPPLNNIRSHQRLDFVHI